MVKCLFINGISGLFFYSRFLVIYQYFGKLSMTNNQKAVSLCHLEPACRQAGLSKDVEGGL